MSRPVELYRFSLGTQVWAYAAAEVPIALAPYTYAPEQISRSALEYTMQSPRQPITVTLRRDHPIALMFASGAQPGMMSLTILEVDRDTAVSRVVWRGRVIGPEWRTQREGLVCALRCEPQFVTLQRGMLRLRVSASCYKRLYSEICRASRAAMQTTGTVTAVAGASVSAQAFGTFPDGWFSGGYLEWGAQQRRMILSHTGVTVTLSGAPAGLAAGLVVQAFPGCDHTLETCRDKFANLANHGGKRFIPTRNPNTQGLS